MPDWVERLRKAYKLVPWLEHTITQLTERCAIPGTIVSTGESLNSLESHYVQAFGRGRGSWNMFVVSTRTDT